MIRKLYIIFIMALTGGLAVLPVRGAAQDGAIVAVGQAGASEEATVHELVAVAYGDGDVTGTELRGTHRLPEASGEAKVEWHGGVAEIEIEFDEMKPAYLFGGDFNTYVLWAAAPEGHLENVGEVVLDGNRSKLNVTTNMDTFAMFVTAEPYYIVDHPSRFIVLENVETREPVEDAGHVAEIRFAPYEGHYAFDVETIGGASEADGEVHTILDQAVTAIELAREAGAETLAAAELSEAEAALNQAAGAAESADEIDDETAERLAREAVRKADQAQDIALERALSSAATAPR